MPPPPTTPFSLYNISSPEGVNVAAMKNTDSQRNKRGVTTKHENTNSPVYQVTESDIRKIEMP
jgi:hypothetical protein